MLGASINVPTLGGRVKLAIPAGAHAGQKMRLKAKGLPGKPPGDQFVILKIVVPRIKSDEDRALVEKMQAQMAFNPRAELEVSA
jgi:curved DNA-binding protein